MERLPRLVHHLCEWNPGCTIPASRWFIYRSELDSENDFVLALCDECSKEFLMKICGVNYQEVTQEEADIWEVHSA
jgi:hypothetical protein